MQHGPDVIGLLAAIFDNFEQGNLGTCADVAETVVYLGLEALKCLCDAEVNRDIFSTKISPFSCIYCNVLNLASPICSFR